MSGMSNSTIDDIGCTGVVSRGRAPVLPTPETYFHNLFEGVEAWYDHLALKAAQKGWGEPETTLADLDMQAMYAGQHQRFLVAFVNGKGKHAMAISVYKRDEGVRVYEITAYIS